MKKNKKQYVYQIFERIAENYDHANIRISCGMQYFWKSCLVRELCMHLHEQDRFLDVCCGTGDIARAVAARKKKVFVTGLDFSVSMLKIAKRKHGVSHKIRWIQGDAGKLPFVDASFDVVAISFGLRNLEDYETALREIRRVLRPGGYICCLDSYIPEHPWIRPFYKGYFRWLMPVLGGGRKYKKEYGWLYESTRRFLTKEELTVLMKQVGFRKVRYRRFFFGVSALHVGQC